ncbi:glycerol-3-phosphate ABC transporter ATP-binding protein [filamentous cyanobacterium CCP2]|nr:glycerol-3-phosphate ABC transporter ATP-binding protein [filamentous cyanobacterium CCP2]
MSSVTFEQVSKRYGGLIAVKDFNLEIEDGEFFVLVGPSGCGKTTSLRMLAGLEEISQGNLYINGKRMNDVPARERDIAMVFQSYALYPHMTVFENMAFSLELQKVPKAEIKERITSAAKQLEIEPLLDRKPRQLSGGQRQRVAVGRAIVRNPAVFLMDEPLSNLDAKLRVQARAELSKLHRKLGTTFVYVTHDQVEAMTLGTRIAVMNQGILQQVGTPQTLYNEPRNTFVAGFMGSPAMNFLPAKLVDQDGQLTVIGNAFTLIIPSEQRSHYAPYRDQEIIFGIRPENLHVPGFIPPGIQPLPFKANLSVIEMMGNELVLYLSTADRQELVARVDPRAPLRIGETVEMVMDISRFYLFDPISGDRLGMVQ